MAPTKIVTLAVLGALLASCTWPGTDPLEFAVVLNSADTAVVVYIDYADGETSIMELQPGETDVTNFSGPDQCAPASLIARDPSGAEVARRDRPFCVGDRWEIEPSN